MRPLLTTVVVLVLTVIAADDCFAALCRCRGARHHCRTATACRTQSPADCGWTQSMCVNQPIPSGFVVTGYHKDPSCGTAAWITRINTCPLGTSIGCCINQSVPYGWFTSGTYFKANCPNIGPGVHNAMIIIRAQ
jgi:hypothetical protein